MVRSRISVTSASFSERSAESRRIHVNSNVLDYGILGAAMAFVVSKGNLNDDYKLLDIRGVIVPVLLSIIIILKRIIKTPKTDKISETVEILPGIGVQLYSNGKIVRFLPEDDIIDIIMTEIVKSYKVVTCVCFRIRSFQSTVEIVPAFPSFEMHYIECEQAWSEINKAILKENTKRIDGH